MKSIAEHLTMLDLSDDGPMFQGFVEGMCGQLVQWDAVDLFSLYDVVVVGKREDFTIAARRYFDDVLYLLAVAASEGAQTVRALNVLCGTHGEAEAGRLLAVGLLMRGELGRQRIFLAEVIEEALGGMQLPEVSVDDAGLMYVEDGFDNPIEIG